MLLCLVVFLSVCLASERARADGYYGPDPDYAPSVFTYAWRGFVIGGLDGLSGGYLVARHDGFEGDDWKPMVYGLGIGALSGSVLGFTLGFVDLADDQPGRGNIALRDMVYGVGFGAVAGAVVGGLVVIKSHDAEHILFGAAIGALSGTALGLAIGLIEGRRITSSPTHRYQGSLEAPRLSLAIGHATDVRGESVFHPALFGRF